MHRLCFSHSEERTNPGYSGSRIWSPRSRAELQKRITWASSTNLLLAPTATLTPTGLRTWRPFVGLRPQILPGFIFRGRRKSKRCLRKSKSVVVAQEPTRKTSTNMRMIRVTTTGLLLLCVTASAVLLGCSKESIRWGLIGLDYSTNTLDVYWQREVILDKTKFWEHSLNLKVIQSSFLRTRMDLNSLRSVDEAVSAESFHSICQIKTNCLTALGLSKRQDLLTVEDVNCEGNWALMRTMTSQWLVRFGAQAQTNTLPTVRPFSFDRGAVNESGDCAFFSVGAPYQRSLKDGGPFALLRKGKWYETRLPGNFPEKETINYSRTSTIPALVPIPAGRIEMTTP